MRVVTNPAERAFHGYAGPAPIYVAPDKSLLVDRFIDDDPGHVRIVTGRLDSMMARLTDADATAMATAILAQLAKPGGISPVELSLLLHRHRPVEVGTCRVCGHELTIASMGSGEATKYVCGSDAASIIGKPGGLFGAAAKEADEHRRGSEVKVSYHGDEGLVAVLGELRRLRELLGDDMTVPVGATYFPRGHGRHRCIIVLHHRGGDVWEQQYDGDYTHDPTHKELEPVDDNDAA